MSRCSEKESTQRLHEQFWPTDISDTHRVGGVRVDAETRVEVDVSALLVDAEVHGRVVVADDAVADRVERRRLVGVRRLHRVDAAPHREALLDLRRVREALEHRALLVLPDADGDVSLGAAARRVPTVQRAHFELQNMCRGKLSFGDDARRVQKI